MCQGLFGGRSDEYIVWVYGEDSVTRFNGVVLLGNRVSPYSVEEKNGLLYTNFNRTLADSFANEFILDMQGSPKPLRITMIDVSLYGMYGEGRSAGFDHTDVQRALKNSGRALGNFSDFLYSEDTLRHAYEKFRFEGDVNKPPFEEVYGNVKAYIKNEISNGNQV